MGVWGLGFGGLEVRAWGLKVLGLKGLGKSWRKGRLFARNLTQLICSVTIGWLERRLNGARPANMPTNPAMEIEMGTLPMFVADQISACVVNAGCIHNQEQSQTTTTQRISPFINVANMKRN